MHPAIKKIFNFLLLCGMGLTVRALAAPCPCRGAEFPRFAHYPAAEIACCKNFALWQHLLAAV
jgi:hypothetical protein